MLSVNLTTTFQRLSLCRIALTSLLLQSKLPDQVNLWISMEPYLRDKGIGDTKVIDQLIQSLPSENRCLVQVHWVSNTGPYRKLIPMLREAGPDDIIVTADDDIFYGEHWLSELLRAYEESGCLPVAARVRAKKINFLGQKTSYLHWNLINNHSVINQDFIVTFGGGVVLKRAMFRDKDIANDAFLSLAPTADDLWYSKLLSVNGNSIVAVPSVLNELNFIIHTDGLNNHNFPRVVSIFHKVKIQVWDKFIGFFGFSVCGNDVAYDQVDSYFNEVADE